MNLGRLTLLGGLPALAIIIAGILLARLLFRRRRISRLARSGARLRCHHLPDGRKLPAEELKSLPELAEIQPATLTNLLHRRDIDVATYICDLRTRRKLQTIALLRFDTVTFQAFSYNPDPAHAPAEAFNPELLRFFERQDRPFSISAAGHWLMVYREGTLVKPDELSTFLGEVHSIASMIKRSVLGETQLPQ